jgi:integrase/recombinase XerD
MGSPTAPKLAEMLILAGSTEPATSTPLFHPERWSGFYADYSGDNRNDTYCQIEARNDLEAVVYWLRKTASRSKATLESFSREANRFLSWAAIERGKRLSDITGSDLNAYQKFLMDPQPVNRWIGKRGRPVAQDEGWKPPFSGPLSAASRTTAMRTLQSLFGFLHKVAYLRGDPFYAIHVATPPRQQVHTIRRYLTEAQWEAVKRSLQEMPRDTPLDSRRYHRTRWVLFLLYLSGMRRSEVVNARMNAFIWQPEGRMLRVLGKGRKEREIPVTIRLVHELQIYRESLGLSSWPDGSDDSPLVWRITGSDTDDDTSDQGISNATLNRLMKVLFSAAADRMTGSDPDMANQLRRMSPHWLRHTYGTELLAHGESLEVAQDNLGHESINTTRLYSQVKTQHRVKTTEKAFAGMILPREDLI